MGKDSVKIYSQSMLDKLNSVKDKRPRTVINHILRKGFITSQELKDLYGYNHPPRAIRDVRERGIPIITSRVRGADGRMIAAYKFGNLEDMGNSITKAAGRTVLSKNLKKALIEKYGAQCFIYLEKMDEKKLHVDHRVPYEIGGEQNEDDVEKFMLLSPSANRAKSWACEHCKNWEEKNAEFCLSCFWAQPEKYEHIAGVRERCVSIMFTGKEIEDFDKLVEKAGNETAQTFIKKIIHDHLK